MKTIAASLVTLFVSLSLHAATSCLVAIPGNPLGESTYKPGWGEPPRPVNIRQSTYKPDSISSIDVASGTTVLFVLKTPNFNLRFSFHEQTHSLTGDLFELTADYGRFYLFRATNGDLYQTYKACGSNYQVEGSSLDTSCISKMIPSEDPCINQSDI